MTEARATLKEGAIHLEAHSSLIKPPLKTLKHFQISVVFMRLAPISCQYVLVPCLVNCTQVILQASQMVAKVNK